MKSRIHKATRTSTAGFTLIELVIVVAIVGILAAAVLPLGRWAVKRQHEYELQQNLRILRNAIDRYHDMALAGLIETRPGDPGYPPDLESLVEGVPLTGEIPSPVPGVSDEFSATGAGLTGGLAGAAEAARAPGFDELMGGDSGGRRGGSAVGGLGAQQRGARGGGSRLGQSLMEQARQGGLGQRSGGGQGGRGGAGLSSLGSLGRERTPGQAEEIVFLRRIPVDPFTGNSDWGMRCYGEDPADRSWCGRNVFDVYSRSRGRGIDGRPYREW